MSTAYVLLACQSCGKGADELWPGQVCSACWYCLCGGDRASDFDLAHPPVVWLSEARRSAAEEEA